MNKRCRTLAMLLFASLYSEVQAKNPDCSGTNQWATTMAFVHLKNEGLTSSGKIDSKRTKTVLLTSEKIGRDLYRQVHHVVFRQTSGATIEVITINEASSEECSMSGVRVFVVSTELGGAKQDVCERKSRGWSEMRETLQAVSRFRGENDADIQMIAGEALGRSSKFAIGDFEFQYARGKSGAPPPNDAVCFPKTVTFEAIRNDGEDAAYECHASMDVKGKVISIECKLVAG